MKRTAFISHSSQDRVTAETICAFLERHGTLCWIAPRDVTPGENYGAAIVNAIDECEVFILLLSAVSNESPQVTREVERAASSNSIIIPVRIEAVMPSKNLEFYVSSSHWLDATTGPLEQYCTKLLAAIESWRKNGTPGRRRTLEPKEEMLPSYEPAAPAVSAGKSRRRPSVVAVVLLAAIALFAMFLLLPHDKPAPPDVPVTPAPPTPEPIAELKRSLPTPVVTPVPAMKAAPTAPFAAAAKTPYSSFADFDRSSSSDELKEPESKGLDLNNPEVAKKYQEENRKYLDALEERRKAEERKSEELSNIIKNFGK